MTSTLALVVIDLQLALVTGAYRERELLHTVNGLIATVREAEPRQRLEAVLGAALG